MLAVPMRQKSMSHRNVMMKKVKIKLKDWLIYPIFVVKGWRLLTYFYFLNLPNNFIILNEHFKFKFPSLDSHLIFLNFWLPHVCEQWPRNDILINWHIMPQLDFSLNVHLFPFSCTIEYTCHGSWLENQTTTFIIARHSKYLVCISFKQLTTDTAQLFIGDSCYREQQGAPLDDYAERFYSVANLTNVGRKYFVFRWSQ